jgi:hypothetical protein
MKNIFSRLKNKLKPKTVNLTEKNYKKIKTKNIFLSKVINHYIGSNGRDFLLLEYSDDYLKNPNRIQTSVNLSAENYTKILGCNLTNLVNTIISKM